MIVAGTCRPSAYVVHRWRCLACSHQVSAMTERAAVFALDAHQRAMHSGTLKIVRGGDEPAAPVERPC